MTNRFRRLIAAQELADLSNEWQNAMVDTSKYYMTVLSAYECDIPQVEWPQANP